MAKRDVEKVYSRSQFAGKLRRLADAVEKRRSFTIQVAGKRFTVPADAEVSVEHEKTSGHEELELQVKWTPKG